MTCIRVTCLFLLCVLCFLLSSCKSEPRNYAAVASYYQYDFTAAREALRADATDDEPDNLTILDNTRLGLAALADGDLAEAESALSTSFNLLSTAGLNKDKTVAVFLDHEGVRIWKGEPFEQALTYHYVALLYALRGDWENMRAAASNALFRLTDFGKDQNAETLTKNAAKDDDYLETGYTAVDTNFALGFLMQAIGADLAGTAGAKEQFDAALKINSDLKPIVECLRERDYDTLVIVDYGRGPMKQAYGLDDALVHFVPCDPVPSQLTISADSKRLARANPVCDVNAMAADHRWNNLEDIRRAKSFIGNALLAGGLVATAYGADREDAGTALAGVGAMALGLLTRSGARADTRYCEFMPQSIFLVPLRLEQPVDLTIEITNRPAATMFLRHVQPGTTRNPGTYYLRLFPDGSGADISWLTRQREFHTNDNTGVVSGAHAYPWILGGRDVSTPTRETFDAYQAAGFLRDLTFADLLDRYQAEGILIGSGMQRDPRQPRDPSFRHILEDGVGLFTPYPQSMGYKRLMFTRHPPYRPQSDAVRNAATRRSVHNRQPIDNSNQDQENTQHAYE
jgi:hypothetical protein